MKRMYSVLLVCLSIFSSISCSRIREGENQSGGDLSGSKSTMLEVVTTFGGMDSNSRNFMAACAAWEKATGNTINDMSAISDDTFKVRILADFETGSEPDVLFFFVGVDANPLIEAGKVVSLGEIRQEYPDYAANMNDSLIPVSQVDGKSYAVPVNGFWEALYVNTEVLAAAGVAMPGADYTWDQFLLDCGQIKASGYIPIAAALGHIPHYWLEYVVFNHSSPTTHLRIPVSPDDDAGQAWLAGIGDIKTLYQAEFFPKNTLTTTDDETFALFTGGQAAFLLDGSWKVGSIAIACQSDSGDPDSLIPEELEKFDITFFPGLGDRQATDVIGGLSMGCFITRRAWENPEKRDAAVSFVCFITSNEIVARFAQDTATALEEAPEAEELNSLQRKAGRMLSESASLTGSVQDILPSEVRMLIFSGLPDVLTNNIKAREILQDGLDAWPVPK